MRSVTALLFGFLAVTVPASAVAQDYSGLRAGISPDSQFAEPVAAGPVLGVGQGAGDAGESVGRMSFIQEFRPGGRDGLGRETAFTARLRASYQATPSVAPFVEGALALADSDPGWAAARARGDTQTWRGGLAFAPAGGGPLRAEVAVGYRQEQSSTTGDSAGALTFDSSVVWTPTAFTTVTVSGVAAMSAADGPMDMGSFIYDGSVSLAHSFGSGFSVLGSATAWREAFSAGGEADSAYTAGFSATWKMSDAHQLTAGYEHAWQNGAGTVGDSQSDAVRVELKVQR